MPSPEFRAWMSQWRAAAIELRSVRDRELRELDGPPADVAAAQAPLPREPGPHAWSGLVDQQAWFVRQRLIQQPSAPAIPADSNREG